MSLDEAIWEATTFTKNRERFIIRHVPASPLEAGIDQVRQHRPLSGQQLWVDGTLVEAWASKGSYRRKDDDFEPHAAPPDFNGETRRCDTHECKTDPDARLNKKAQGQASRLCYIDHVLTDNRHALVEDVETTRATYTAEVDAALKMFGRRSGKRRRTTKL